VTASGRDLAELLRLARETLHRALIIAGDAQTQENRLRLATDQAASLRRVADSAVAEARIMVARAERATEGRAGAT
jgi:hypothetical protein